MIYQFKSFLIFLLLFSNTLNSQNFTGFYNSNKTSYADRLNSDNNFIEETLFNIAIALDEEKGYGELLIQDPRMPDRLLSYSLNPSNDILKKDNKILFIYKAIRDEIGQDCKVVIYEDSNGSLNLMIEEEDQSQMFFNLKKDSP